MLLHNCSNLNKTNLELRQEAVWIRDEELSFESDASLSGHISEEIKPAAVRVKAIRLRHILDKYLTVDFLKLDIEFAELKVIQDLGMELSKVNHLFVEFHNNGGRYIDDLSAILRIWESAGFKYYLREAFNFVEFPVSFKGRKELSEAGNYLNIFAVNVGRD